MTTEPLYAMIEDDPMCRVVVRKQMEGSSQPCRIIEFDNGHSAIKHFLSASRDNQPLPDVIFLDLFMPVMDGWEFLDHLSSMLHLFTRQPRIYILTGSEDPGLRDKAARYDMVTDFIIKPIKLRLVEIIMRECANAVH